MANHHARSRNEPEFAVPGGLGSIYAGGMRIPEPMLRTLAPQRGDAGSLDDGAQLGRVPAEHALCRLVLRRNSGREGGGRSALRPTPSAPGRRCYVACLARLRTSASPSARPAMAARWWSVGTEGVGVFSDCRGSPLTC